MRNTPLLVSVFLLLLLLCPLASVCFPARECAASDSAWPSASLVASSSGSPSLSPAAGVPVELPGEAPVDLPGISRFAGLPPDSVVTVWVFFTDKGPGMDVRREVRAVERRFSPRALARRAKVRGDALVDWRDLPVSQEYIQRLRAMGFEVRAFSRWVNAASVRCRAGELYRLYQIPFVRQLRPVASFHRRDITMEPVPTPATPVEPGLAVSSEARALAPGDTSFYGGTWRQLDLMQVPQLHAQGYTGSGVFVGVLDTGFDLSHEALQNVNVIAQWDFINWDSVVANQAGQDAYNQYYHGTFIIGLLAGYKPGTYSGAAFDADYALAKTEYVPTETPIEEDYWVMGVEWLDSLGVDLVSSSLGYIDWYTYADMNGDSAVTTIAADIAVSNGVSIFNAMGNEGATSYPYMIAPADGDSVMSIGAVDSLGVIWPQSSRGPTYDDRIKPEVVTQGKVPLCVSPVLPTSYVRVSGTSCATPLAAGACALVLQKNPTWVPMMLREAARATATNSASPDTAIGWGILKAKNASDYVIVSVDEKPLGTPRQGRTVINVDSEPNPFNPVTTIRMLVVTAPGAEQATALSAKMFDISGRCVRDFGRLPLTESAAEIVWNGKSDGGEVLPSGVYVFTARYGDAVATRKLLLLK